MRTRLPYSIRKFLRCEKSRIRRNFEHAEAEEKIRALMERIHRTYTHSKVAKQ